MKRIFNNVICILAISIGASFNLLTWATIGHDESANRRRHRIRSLQQETNAACSAPLEEALLVVGNGEYSNVPIFRASFYETCIGSLWVNTDNMLQHIQSLQNIFRQYHSFYTIAKDPADSDPNSHQPEIGYVVYGKGQGQVDLAVRLDELMATVEANGATGATFWEINEAFALLRDGHIQPPVFRDDFPAGPYYLAVYPEGSLNGGTVESSPIFYYDSNGVLQLKIHWLDANNVVGESHVQNIDGKSVAEFFLDMANAPIPNQFPTAGARMNNLLTFMLRYVDKAFDTWPFWEWDTLQPYLFKVYGGWFAQMVRPSHWFPDTFRVVYCNGESETYHSGVKMEKFSLESLGRAFTDSSGRKVYQIDIGEAGAKLNRPGPGYYNYTRAMELAFGSNIRSSAGTTSTRLGDIGYERSTSNDGENKRRLKPNRYVFDRVDWLRKPLPDQDSTVGYKINKEEGYAVLKVQGFNVFPEDALEIWKNVTQAAKENGIRKLIVDISNNLGGNVVAGNALAVGMFPSVPYEIFQNAFDGNRNELMYLYHKTLQRLLNTIKDSTARFSESVSSSALIQRLKAGVDALKLLLENDFVTGIKDDDERAMLVQQIESEITRLEENQHPSRATEIITHLLNLVEATNPWNVIFLPRDWERTKAVIEWDGEKDGVNVRDQVRTVKRGGVETNLTAGLTIFSRELYNQAVSAGVELDNVFDECILVSNGIAGSTTAIFADTVMQIARNPDKSYRTAKVTTVTYGGTGSNTTDGIALAGNPISTNMPRYGRAAMANVGMSMLEHFLPSDDSLSTAFAAARALYEEHLPEPPYFALNGNAAMPTCNYYDSFMQPGALPLQYIHIYPDRHIPQLYTNVIFGSSGDLQALYKETAKFFSSVATPAIGRAPGKEEPVDNANTTPENAAVSGINLVHWTTFGAMFASWIGLLF